MEGSVGVFIEVFGEVVNDISPISLDGGIAFSVSDALVVDAAAAVGINDYATDFVFQVGLTTKLFKIF